MIIIPKSSGKWLSIPLGKFNFTRQNSAKGLEHMLRFADQSSANKTPREKGGNPELPPKI